MSLETAVGQSQQQSCGNGDYGDGIFAAAVDDGIAMVVGQ